MFGYTAVAFNITLYAFHKELKLGGQKIESVELRVFVLEDHAGRYRLLLALLHISRLLKSLASFSPPSGQDELITLNRENCIQVDVE